MKSLYLIIFSFLIGCTYEAERIDVTTKSSYLNKEFLSQMPLVYINNLPHQNNVSKYIATNTSVLVATEATKELRRVRNNCTNCIGPNRLVKPIRVSYVPEGTQFTVIKEYILKFNKFPFATSKSNYFLLKDKEGNVTEISIISFENFFIPNNYGLIEPSESQRILSDLKTFDSKKILTVIFCPRSHPFKTQDVKVFFDDFSLNREVTTYNNSDYCEGGSLLEFKTPESYLTTRYYFSEWLHYGTWHTL